MKIMLNEKSHFVSSGTTAFQLRDEVKPDADIVVFNGFIVKEDYPLKDGDKITLIKRGEIPSQEEMESLLVARHTPGVHESVKKAFVGIAGLGGLGSNVAVSLARLGIGRLLLIDFDIVEPSNLNRQQYFINHIGMPKTEALKELIAQINPFVEVETKDAYLDSTNIKEVFSDVDIIVEAFDNPQSKAELVNIVLQSLPNKPIVAASGMAGYFSNNLITTKKIRENFYLVGDDTSEAKPGSGLMAPRVGIAANHQANMVLRLILGEKDI
ncbi:Sulfur carrier protein ThiS / Sulfur carrier protein ThiS adenylyltransferase [Candidatus Syntrophocurvum alkaliphilum]|uniref:Sulfur carrier protein ThiS / Sulfur carrier protein ThiS adenylyltransferase n=1 Tax=Candidatus Syntrophocurvum alkaliphilum TaxID=2293317 RepID=A0A6I6DII2_9FIRM|nr:sulfur carrier protein ThiS adenylyltransferase ThiF [Candidatus Syntrophocurvum alkaliphilum]QGU00674.1 Sulfur carrier protein ThiS / Sulfur carrier protein ThiS adenylyltransferase [Candidatus Syntrophocurvum alkaliphilum]